MDERRIAPRIRAAFKVALLLSNRFWRRSEVRARSVDISTYGIGLALGSPIDDLRQIGMRIYGPSLEGAIEASGMVMWQSKGPNHSYRAGIKFTEIAWSKIRDLIRSI